MYVRMLVVVAVIALVAGCGVPPSPVAPSAGPPTQSPTAHLELTGLALDYPATWQSTYVGRLLHYETVVAFLTSGAATASEPCGSAYVPGMGDGCSQVIKLASNSAVVRISLWDVPSGAGGPIAADIADGWSAMIIGGEPAAFTDRPGVGQGIPDSDAVLIWAVAVPGSDDLKSYQITAGIRGPDVASIESQVEAMIGTIHVSAIP